MRGIGDAFSLRAYSTPAQFSGRLASIPFVFGASNKKQKTVRWDDGSSKDIGGALFLTFWFGMCSGWMWRHCNSCLLSAILQSLVLFIGKNVFSNDESLCSGAC